MIPVLDPEPILSLNLDPDPAEGLVSNAHTMDPVEKLISIILI